MKVMMICLHTIEKLNTKGMLFSNKQDDKSKIEENKIWKN